MEFNIDIKEKERTENAATLKFLINKAIAIFRSYGAQKVYLFGSANNGSFNYEQSDIDFAVSGIPPKDFYRAVGEVMCTLKREIDVIDLDAGTAFGKFLTEHGELSRVA